MCEGITKINRDKDGTVWSKLISGQLGTTKVMNSDVFNWQNPSFLIL